MPTQVDGLPLAPATATQRLFDYVSSEVAHRREPELAYTAASIASFGAVAWGVAAVAAMPQHCIPWWRHPALAGAAGVVILAVCVVAKILREHCGYVALRKQQIKLAEIIFAEEQRNDVWNLQAAAVGRGYRGGHRWSLAIVIGAAVAAVLFCLSVFFAR